MMRPRFALRLLAIGALAALSGGCDRGAQGTGIKIERLPPEAIGVPVRTAPAFPADVEDADTADSQPSNGLPPGHPSLDGGAQSGDAGANSRGDVPNDSVHAGLHLGSDAAPDAAPQGMATSAPAAETDGDANLPLPRTGLNSADELRRALASIPDAEARKLFERAFRLTFTTRREARGYQEARDLLDKALGIEPRLAEAYRVIGYAGFNSGMTMDQVLALYRKAVEIKPDYGEAHYALAFFLGASDPQEGADHFRRAMKLGVPDERNLRATYYQKIEMH